MWPGKHLLEGDNPRPGPQHRQAVAGYSVLRAFLQSGLRPSTGLGAETALNLCKPLTTTLGSLEPHPPIAALQGALWAPGLLVPPHKLRKRSFIAADNPQLPREILVVDRNTKTALQPLGASSQEFVSMR